MKIELLTDSYSNASGFKLEGAGIHEVDATRASYLLETFPDWFQAVDQDVEPAAEAVAVEDDSESQAAPANDGVDEADQPGTGESDQTEAPEASQELSEDHAPTKPLSKMNKTELQALGADKGIELTEEMTPDQMREAIKAN